MRVRCVPSIAMQSRDRSQPFPVYFTAPVRRFFLNCIVGIIYRTRKCIIYKLATPSPLTPRSPSRRFRLEASKRSVTSRSFASTRHSNLHSVLFEQYDVTLQAYWSLVDSNFALAYLSFLAVDLNQNELVPRNQPRNIRIHKHLWGWGDERNLRITQVYAKRGT